MHHGNNRSITRAAMSARVSIMQLPCPLGSVSAACACELNCTAKGCKQSLPANRPLNLPHHAKVNVSQLASFHLEQIPRVGVAMVVPLF